MWWSAALSFVGALVGAAQRRREREDKRIEQIARLPLPEDD